jgi:hypothetical protein
MAKETKQIDTRESIQKFITEGREVLIKKENETSFVRIYLNNEDIDYTQKWCISINGNEFYVSEILINCFTRTLTEDIKEVVFVHHIVCEAKEILFKDNVATIN